MASENDRAELIAKLSELTSLGRQEAETLLEQSDWNVELATSLFFEGGSPAGGSPPGDIQSSAMDAASERNDRARMGMPPPQAASGGGAAGGGRPPGPPRERPKIATLASMKSDAAGQKEDGQAFYAGGSERSGQQIIGPPRDGGEDRATNLVANMFRAAKSHGAEVVDDEGPSAQQRNIFGGTGHKLGSTEGPAAEKVPDDKAEGEAPAAPSRLVTLRLWQNGFSVDDGPLRGYDDEENEQFLECIRRGQVPMELVAEARGAQVDLNMEDHRDRDYVRPKAALKPFSGEGHMLGSPAPTVAQAAAPPAAEPAGAAGGGDVIKVDAGQPVTQLQIRLADGSRMVEKFNHGHKIADIRNLILTRYPQYAGASFVLMTTFPNKELSDEAQTLKDAGLINAVIVQRLK